MAPARIARAADATKNWRPATRVVSPGLESIRGRGGSDSRARHARIFVPGSGTQRLDRESLRPGISQDACPNVMGGSPAGRPRSQISLVANRKGKHAPGPERTPG